MTAMVIPLNRPDPPVPPEVQAVVALLQGVSDPQLRRYCLEQIRAAESGAEVADALALTRALGGADDRLPRAAPDGPPADAGHGQPAARRRILSAPRKGNLRCIATSSSP